MTLWCPSCRKEWPAERNTCPDCMVDLVADPTATVRCRHCGRDWPATMQSCPNCLSELVVEPDAAADALGRILASGGHLYRPDGVAPFADGPACTLLRLSGRGALVFTGADGLVEAGVSGSEGAALPPLTCADHDGSVLFRLLAYDAAERAVVAVGADGAALATYLRAGVDVVDVRDETSAPAARLVGQRSRFELVETGGGVLAAVGSSDSELDGWVDDQWWLELRPGVDRLPLRLLGAVGLVLAAKVLLGRATPVRAPGIPDEPGEYEPWPFG